MNVYTIPRSGAGILADAVAAAQLEAPEFVDVIAAGSPVVRVDATSDGYGNMYAVVKAGVMTDGGFASAHVYEVFAPRIEFRAKDGRLSAADNAKRVMGRFFDFASPVPIEWRSVGR